jgi:hypothetical protein
MAENFIPKRALGYFPKGKGISEQQQVGVLQNIL